jgi:hypothetical protein
MPASSIARGYLVLYNLGQAVGWGLCLVALIQAAAEGKDSQGIYEAANVYARACPLCSKAPVTRTLPNSLTRSSRRLDAVHSISRNHTRSHRCAANRPSHQTGNLPQIPAGALVKAAGLVQVWFLAAHFKTSCNGLAKQTLCTA